MDPFTIALGANLAGSALSSAFNRKAIEEQRQAGLERVRRRDLTNNQNLGQASAAAGASGVDLTNPTGSMSKYLADMSQEFTRQHLFALHQVNEGADLSEVANTLGAVGGIGGALSKYGQANNWWQAGPAALGGPG